MHTCLMLLLLLGLSGLSSLFVPWRVAEAYLKGGQGVADPPWGAPTAGGRVGRPQKRWVAHQQEEDPLLGVGLPGKGAVGGGRGLGG